MMPAFTVSGRLDRQKIVENKVAFRPEAATQSSSLPLEFDGYSDRALNSKAAMNPSMTNVRSSTLNGS